MPLWKGCFCGHASLPMLPACTSRCMQADVARVLSCLIVRYPCPLIEAAHRTAKPCPKPCHSLPPLPSTPSLSLSAPRLRRKKEHTERLKRQVAALESENAALQSLLLEMNTTGEAG